MQLNLDNQNQEDLLLKKEQNNLENNDLEKAISIISEIITYILKKKYVILIVMVIVTIVTSIYLIRIPDSYSARASFIPPSPDYISTYNDDITSMSANSLAMSLGSRSMSSLLKNPSDIYIQILQGNNISTYIINKFNLMNEFKVQYMDDAIARLGKMVDIKNTSGLLEITVTSKDPKLAADISNAYLEKLPKELNNINIGNLRESRLFIGKRLNEIHSNLSEASKRLRNFQVKNKTIDIEKQGQALINTASTLQTQIIIAESELKALESTFTQNSVRVKEKQAQIQNLTNELNKIKGQNGNSANPSSLSSDSDVGILDLPKMGVDYVELYRNVTIMEQVYLLLTKEYEFAKIKEIKDSIKLKVIDRAFVPKRKSWPPRTLILVGVVAASMFLTIICLILSYFISNLKYTSPKSYNSLIKIKNEFFSELLFIRSKKNN